MPSYTQEDRPLAITTPLGKDVLLLSSFRGSEAISELFSFQLDLLAQVETPVHFDSLLGQHVTVELRLPSEKTRFLNGIIKSFTQGSRDDIFTHYRAEMVPQIWLLAKRVRCRIFQRLAVPDILHEVFAGMDVTYETTGTYLPRDYCVQYRESDFDFASRLMEEEGIYYFFQHSDGTHKMIVSDSTNRHPAVPGEDKVIYDEIAGTVGQGSLVRSWEKTQELRSGAYTLWDHCFEMPGKNLEAKERTVESIVAGKVTHKLHVGGNDHLEVYDYPGGYAQRFDGVDRGGTPQPQTLKDVIKDGERTVRIRMEQEEVEGLRIEGTSGCGQFTAGHKFTLEHHFDGDGEYLLTRLQHNARMGEGSYRSAGAASDFHYENRFTCTPTALPYRPQRRTHKPVISGVQTATVVGPPGEEIFCDKYGRVKVQFHWDREGKNNASSSCWLRVAQVWAGKGWGAFFWPRIGHEVVVVFEEGDPDQPLIVGSVYNAQNMPPFSLPKFSTFGGFKSCSVEGSPSKNYNGLLFVDAKSHEHLAIHSERHMVIYAEYDRTYRVGRHQAERVPGARAVTVGGVPVGGGSGGGPNKNLFQPPEPTSFAGINSVVVYGGNFQIAFPLNMQVAYGTNMQICVNPATWGLSFPDEGTNPVSESAFQVLGSGIGGNMQLTLGTNAQVVMGQSINVNLGPPPLNFGTGANNFSSSASLLTGDLMSLGIFIFLSAYSIPDDDFRSILLMVFQGLMQALLCYLMKIEHVCDMNDTAQKKIYDQIHLTATTQANRPIAEVLGILTSLTLSAVLPPVIESFEEKQLDNTGS